MALEIEIDGKKVREFSSISISKGYDTVASSFAFNSPFDPTSELHRAIFQPDSYHKVILRDDDTTELTGRMYVSEFESGPEPQSVQLEGQSLAGVLEDCEIPLDLYPLEHDNKTVEEIFRHLISPWFPDQFGLVIESPAINAANSRLDKSTPDANGTILDYLSEIVAQKNIILTHDTVGNIVLTRLQPGRPVADLSRGKPGVNSQSLSFDGKTMHDEITVQRQASPEGGNAGQSTVRNPLVGVYRPTVSEQTTSDDVNTEDAARAKRSEELKAISLNVDLDHWRVEGRMLRPGDIVEMENPELFLFNKSRWTITDIDFKWSVSEGETASLTLVLPEVYTEENPQYIFQY